MIVFTTLQALLSLSWTVASRGMESCFPTVLAAVLGASYFFLVFLLAVFLRWRFLVRLSWVSCTSSSISLRFSPLLFHLGHFVIFFHVFYLLVNVFSLAGFFEELVKCPPLLYAFLDKVVILDSLYQLFEDPVVGLVAEFTIFRLLA